MVSLGSIFSSIWIVIANSWQQTPAGHHTVPLPGGGMRAEITDFWAMVFNPSTANRLVHVWLAAFIMGAFFILSISAWYLLRERHVEFARRSFRGALLLAAVSSLAILVSGHFNADMVAEHQPAKLAALEGHYESGPADLYLFGVPLADEMRFGIAVPGGLSFLTFGDFSSPLPGLDRFRPKDRPNVPITFVSYHLMVASGIAFIVLSWCGLFLLWRGSLFNQRIVLWLFVLAVIPAVIANETGWTAAEAGRQPWVVQPPVPRAADGTVITGADGFVHYDEQLGLRIANGVSRNITAGQVGLSIAGFGAIYALLGFVWLWVLNHKIQAGPDEPPPAHPEHTSFLDVAAERPSREQEEVIP